MGNLVCQLLFIYFLVLMGRIILSWFPIAPGSGLASVFSVLYNLTEPVLGPVRRMMPPLGVGGMGLDLSPIIVIFGLQIFRAAICG